MSLEYFTNLMLNGVLHGDLQASFVIPPEVIPGRMTLLVTLFLVLINIFINVTTTSPNTESLTSISAWIIICILYVCLALLEYGGILLFKYVFDEHAMKSVKNVDLFSLSLSSITFIIFNVLFWNLQFL